MASQYLDVNSPVHLYQGDTVLGVLEVEDIDQPYFLCIFTPSAAFAEIRPLFDEEARLVNMRDKDAAARDQLWKTIDSIRDLGIRLVGINGETDDFILHIDGSRASFRYGEFTPFR